MKNKIIVFGNPSLSIRHLKEPDVRVTSFNFNHQAMTIEIVYEEGLRVNSFNLSVFAAIEVGLIDLNVLNKIL
jgi:hypothetical protein